MKKPWVRRWRKPARERAGPERRHHVAELGDGRVREHALDVALHEASVAARSAVKAPDPGDQESAPPGHGQEERVGPRHQVDAGGDHRRGVDQRGDRRRALHRVGQPDVERELGRLADGAEVDAAIM